MRDQSYTIIYTTSPPSKQPSGREPPPYEMDDPFEGVLHTDLKRDLSAHGKNRTQNSNLPLFEKYQFLSPGMLPFFPPSSVPVLTGLPQAIFMGLFVTFILF